jgi:integrase
MADRDGGLVFDTKNQTVGEYLERWLNDAVRGSVKPVTLENRERVVRNHLTPALGRIKLKALTPAHIQSLYRAKLDEGLAPSTVHQIHSVLHTALKQAVKWELVPRNASGQNPRTRRSRATRRYIPSTLLKPKRFFWRRVRIAWRPFMCWPSPQA